MRISSYCLAEGYQLDNLVRSFNSKKVDHEFFEKEVIYFNAKDVLEKGKKKKGADEESSDGEIFIFKLGIIVFWNCDPEEEKEITSILKQFAKERYREAKVEREDCSYKIEFSGDAYVDEENDLIVLDNGDTLTKLAVSYALAYSTKLTFFEESVKNTIQENEDLPQEFIKKGKISLSSRELSKKMGRLFLERNRINLHSDILYTPDFFWKRPQYEAYYHMVIELLDMEKRAEILNRKLDVINELYGILSGELQHNQSSRLEIVIIILIFVEVMLVVLKDILHWI